ncbi:hypothetical protein JGH11_19625 [Dysgonomonas sp. Marseille-P4677]|uniref:hypothetical protein n=1 Tax=Dysgonomonas sp. Marseille-P4677 TaxID=2364790 RepID=UPI0019120B04|nr:hypothetical protein [Dysgonomonas sp. Marseille-P4677]MBK5723081.1 hypothetical protein [Dysgonomonas sp. Marseille-P4677]
MKKKTSKQSSRFLIICALPFAIMALTVMISCAASHSVREIRASRDPNAGNIIVPVKIKVKETKDDALIKDLFMQSKRSSIELPIVDKDGKKSAAVISEQVTYVNPEIISSNTGEDKVTNLNEVQHLNEVVVTAKSRFTPEQNGRVNVDFVIRVPKELLSPNFRVTLAPKLLHNDSIVPLKEVVIKGQTFSDKQKQAYADYDAYVKSIVDESKYDSVFVDHKGVMDDIAFQQSFYYQQYHKEWSRQTDFEEWKSTKDDVEAMQTAKQTARDKKIYYENVRKAREKAMKEVAKGKDTTGFFARYMKNVPKPGDLKKGKQIVEQKNDYRLDFYKEYSNRAKEQVMRDWATGKDTVGAYARYMKGFDKNMKTLVLDGEDMNHVPERFRDIYREGRKMKQIKNQALTDQDSIEIAQSRYMFEQIALNEMKKERQEEKRKELIVFPYETNVRLDSVIQTDQQFVYYYKQDYPVSPGMKRLRLTMSTTIDAIDRSQFIQPQSDTLSYFISSLSQLVDSSLIVKTTTVHRDVYNSMTVYPKFATGKSTFNINYKDNKAEIDKVVNTYRTFTGEGKLFMDSVVIRVTTALDGSYDKNIELSMKRAEALKNYFTRVLSDDEYEMNMILKTRFSGEDWNTMAKLIVKRTDMPNKAEILDMLTQAVNPDQCESELKKAYPEDFKIIRDSIYPLLNKAELTFNMTRPDMADEITVNKEVRPDYAKALKLLQDREYWKALDILSNYPDYNTALCLVCMGYNAKALELLDKLKETSNTEYLRAILAIRANDENKAIQHLLRSCELDPTKAYRAPLDPEISQLVSKYGLHDQLNSSEASYDLGLPDDENIQ